MLNDYLVQVQQFVNTNNHNLTIIMKKIFADLQLLIPKNQSAYLVGGWIRDKILGRVVKDYDFVIQGDIEDILKKFVIRINGTLIKLSEKKHLWRIVSREKNIIFDFTPISAENIEGDLSKRDFTINAMAIELDKYNLGVAKIIDPFGGFRDIQDRRIRVVKDASITSDPLRMLRAFRFAAQLGFSIDKHTIDIIQHNIDKILDVAFERITYELFLIFAEDFSYPFVRQLDDIGLLGYIIPEIAEMKGLEQGKYHHLDAWEHTLLALKKLEDCISELSEFDELIQSYLNERFQSNITKKQLLKFATLLHDIGKPATMTRDNKGDYHFYGPAKIGSEMATKICARLKLGKKATSAVNELVKRHLDPLSFLNNDVRTKRAFNRFFNRNGSEGIGILLLFLADMRAARGKQASDLEQHRLGLVKEMLSFRKAQLYPKEKMKKLLNGYDLIETFNLTPGKQIGYIIKLIEDEQVEGKLKTKEQAIDFVKNLLST